MKNCYKFLLFGALLLATLLARGQSSYYWANSIPSSTSVIDVATDSAGNAYTISSGSTSRYVKKYNIKGDLLWTKTYVVNSTVGNVIFNAIEVAPNGTIFIAGSIDTPGDYQIDLGTNTAGKINTGGEEAGLLLSLNSEGDFLWAKSVHASVTGTTPLSYFNDLTLVGTSVYACGSFKGTVGTVTSGNGEWLVCMYTPSSQILGLKTYADFTSATASPNGAIATAIKAAGTGFVVAGNFRPINSSTPYNPFLYKISSANSAVFSRTWGGTGIDKVSDIDVSGDTIITVGTFEGSFTYSGSSTTHTSAGSSDIFIIRSITTSTPSEIVKTIGNATEDRIAKVQLVDRKVYLTGSFQGTLDINPSTAITTELTSTGGFDAFAINFSSTSSNSLFGSTGNTGFVVADGAGVGYGLNLAVSKGELIIGGSFSGLTDFNPASAVNSLTSGGQVGYLAKYGTGCFTPLTPTTITGPSTMCNGNVGTYATKSISATYYEWTLPTNWTGSSVSTQIVATAGVGAGTISVKAFNSCGTASAVRNFTTYQLPMAPQTITGPTDLCYISNRLVSFSNTAATAASSYVWKLPSNWGVVSSLESTTLNNLFKQKVGTGSRISVKGKNACGISLDSAFLDVNIHSRFGVGATPNLSNGLVTSCVGSSISLSVPTMPNASTYSWKISNTNDNFVVNTSVPTLNYNSTKAGSFQATVTYLNADTACAYNFAPSNNLNLTFMAPPTIGSKIITGETLGIEQNPYTYTTLSGGSTNVFRKNGVTVPNATTYTASISFNPGKNVVSLRQENVCGLSTDSAKLNVTILPYNPLVVSYAPANGAAKVTGNQLFTIAFDRNVNPVSGQMFYLYAYNTDALVQSMPVTSATFSTNSVSFTFPNALTSNTKYYITSSATPVRDAMNWPNGSFNSNSIGGKEIWNFTVGLVTGMENSDSENVGVSVMPNPTENELTIQTQGLISAEMFDLTGVQVASGNSNTMDISELPAGVYILNVKSTNGNFKKQIVKK